MSIKKLASKFKIYLKFFNLPVLFIDIICRKIQMKHQQNLLFKRIIDKEFLKGNKIIKYKKGYRIYTLDNKVIKHIYLRNIFSDKSIFIDVFYNNCYSHLQKIIDEIGINPKIIIDAGANIGLFSIYIKSGFPESKVFAIEPDNGNFLVLNENIDSNHLDIIPFQCALMHKSGFVKMGIGVRGTKEKELSYSASFVDNSNVRGVTLFEFCQQNNIGIIDILKIDIEGEEAKIFSSKPNFKNIMDLTKILVIELHDECIDRYYFHKIIYELKYYTVTFGETTYVISNF